MTNEFFSGFTAGFAKGGGKAKGGGGIVGAVLDALAGASGSGGCGTGTVGGKKGFQKGNHCSAKGKSGAGSPALKAAGAHRSARSVVNKHIKAGTLNTKAGRAAVKSAAHHARIVRDAKAAIKAQKSAAGKADRAVASGRATPLSSKPSPMEARVAESVKATASMKAERATGHLNNLHERARAGTVKGDDIHKHVDIIAKGTTKDELFAAAKAAGVEHKATTKKALVEHLKAHATGRMKPGGDKHEAIKESSLKDFAGKVTSGAHASPTGGFGSEKTFISHAKAHLDRDHPDIRAMSDDAFKARLLDAHKAGHLELGRGDLTPSMHPGDVAASSTPHMGVEYHFIRHPEKAAADPKHPAQGHLDGLMAASGAKSHDELAGHLKALAGDKGLLKAAGATLAPRAAAPKIPKAPGAAKAVPPPGPGVPDAVRHLRDLQATSTGRSPSEIDAGVGAISHLSHDDLRHVQREFLGSAVGPSKKAALREIAGKIHNYRQAADRVKGIEEYR